MGRRARGRGFAGSSPAPQHPQSTRTGIANGGLLVLGRALLWFEGFAQLIYLRDTRRTAEALCKLFLEGQIPEAQG